MGGRRVLGTVMGLKPQMILSAAKALLRLLTCAGNEPGASDILKEVAHVESLPCDTFEDFKARETAGAQLAQPMPTHFAKPSTLHLEL